MTENKKRTVQDVFDEERVNDNIIEELEEEIEMVEDLKKKLKICKEKVKTLETERRTLQIDLLKEKKLEWIECNLNEWREYVESGDDPAKYHIYHYDGSIRSQGYYKGEFKLDVKDEEHFEKYFNDYFYYGYPNYQDVNNPNTDGSECYLAFGCGNAHVHTFKWFIGQV
jgi:hypothetical protein